MGLGLLGAALFAAVPAVRFAGDGRLPIVSVEVEDRGRYDFLLDTGTTRTVLSARLAAELNLERHASVLANAPGGSAPFESAEVDSLTLDKLQRGPLTVLVAELPALRDPEVELDGILGLDFLSTFHYVIDYEAGTLFIGLPSEPLPVEGTPIPFRSEEKLILLPSANELWLALDTAAEGLVVTESTGLAIMRDPGDLARLESAAGRLLVRTGSLARLDVGPLVLHDVAVTLLPSSPTRHGLLPAHWFRRLYVNHREGYVVLDPP